MSVVTGDDGAKRGAAKSRVKAPGESAAEMIAAERHALTEKSARLKALRLARDAEGLQSSEKPKATASKARKPRVGRTKKSKGAVAA